MGRPAKVVIVGAEPRKRKRQNYVDNEKLYAALVDYHARAQTAKALGEPAPRASDYIGKVIIDVCNHLSEKPCFVGYTFRDMMIGDGIEKCVAGLHTFNPYAQTRSGKPNAFAWFTQIAFYAFLARIEKEKAYFATKHKNMVNIMVDNLIIGEVNEASNKVIEDFERAQSAKKEKLKQKALEKGI